MVVSSDVRRSPAMRTRAWADLARAAGVSRTTASLALNDHPRVAPKTRQRVAEAAARLGFVRNHGARLLARTRSNVRATPLEQAGIILLSGQPEGLDFVFLEFLRGAEQELSKIQANLLFVRGAGRTDWDKIERITRAGGVDGWLVVGQVDDAAASRLRAAGLPFVILGDHRCTRGLVHNVTIDYLAASRLVVEHLASLGHRRIAFLGGSMTLVYQQELRSGFIAAVDELGLERDDAALLRTKNIWYGPPTGAPAVHQFAQWLRSEPRPTALMAPEADAVDSITRLLRSADFELPRQLSIVGCSYTVASAGSDAPREYGPTRLEMPMAEVGRHGAPAAAKADRRAAIGVQRNARRAVARPRLDHYHFTCPHFIRRIVT
jgi:DNA-binding LacI/PurR family transcriptional regulator